MENFLSDIEKKIKTNIKIEQLKIYDDTENHIKHKFFSKGKYHIRLEIYSNYLKSLSRIDGQKKILDLLKQEIKEKIHAIQIIIK
tara:strand:- start:275 stop:529 length:255 start_codon:yes stop_codon:yes gene_type:complete